MVLRISMALMLSAATMPLCLMASADAGHIKSSLQSAYDLRDVAFSGKNVKVTLAPYASNPVKNYVLKHTANQRGRYEAPLRGTGI